MFYRFFANFLLNIYDDAVETRNPVRTLFRPLLQISTPICPL